MPRKTKMTLQELKDDRWLKDALNIDFAEVEKRVLAGEELVLEETVFSDAGSDYTALYLNNTNIAYIPGY